jgi:hypothetical protein
VLPCLQLLCEHWRLAGPELAEALATSGSLLEYLLENGVIHVH